MRALPAMKVTAQNNNTHYDFTGRRLRLVEKPLNEMTEPSPLHEAIAKYLESLP